MLWIYTYLPDLFVSDLQQVKWQLSPSGVMAVNVGPVTTFCLLKKRIFVICVTCLSQQCNIDVNVIIVSLELMKIGLVYTSTKIMLQQEKRRGRFCRNRPHLFLALLCLQLALQALQSLVMFLPLFWVK